MWAWGRNAYGQLGDGTTIVKYSPLKIGIDTDWQTIESAFETSFAIKTDGTLWGWGLNTSSTIGDGTGVNKKTPVVVNNPTCIIGIEEMYNDKFYSIYPNPVSSTLNIKTDATIEGIVIMDVIGRKILEQNENTSQINIESLEQGMYQLIINSEGKKYSSKFIKD